jgi:hypothetical protein
MQEMAARGFPGLDEPWSTVLIGTIAVAAIVWIAVLERALKSVARSELDTGMKIVWIGFILTSQPLGVLLWSLIGRRDTLRSASTV